MPTTSTINSSPVVPVVNITHNKDGLYRLRDGLEVRFTPHFDFGSGDFSFFVWFMREEDEVFSLCIMSNARWVKQVFKQRCIKHLVLDVDELFNAPEPELLVSAQVAQVLMEHVRLRINIAKRRVVLHFHKEGEQFEVDVGSHLLTEEEFNSIFELTNPST